MTKERSSQYYARRWSDKGSYWHFFYLKTNRNSVSVSVTAPKLEIFLVSVTAVIVKHGFGLLSVTAETTTRFRREPKLSLLAIGYSSTAAVLHIVDQKDS